jgi:hypothetical protein
MKAAKTLIVITWDGVSKPLEYVLQDVERNFDLLIFDHSAKASKELVAHLKPEALPGNPQGQTFVEYLRRRIGFHCRALIISAAPLFHPISVNKASAKCFASKKPRADAFLEYHGARGRYWLQGNSGNIRRAA